MYVFPADSFLLLDRCFLNVMKEMSHIFHNGQLSSSLSVLYQLLLHSLLSFSLDDVRKLTSGPMTSFSSYSQDKALTSVFKIRKMTVYLHVSHYCRAYCDILNMKGAV